MKEEKKLSDGKRTLLYLFSGAYLIFLCYLYGGYLSPKTTLIVTISIPIFIFIWGIIYFSRKSNKEKSKN